MFRLQGSGLGVALNPCRTWVLGEREESIGFRLQGLRSRDWGLEIFELSVEGDPT